MNIIKGVNPAKIVKIMFFFFFRKRVIRYGAIILQSMMRQAQLEKPQKVLERGEVGD